MRRSCARFSIASLATVALAVLVVTSQRLHAAPTPGDPSPAAQPKRMLPESPDAAEHVITIRHRPRKAAPLWGPRTAPVTVDFFLSLRHIRTAREPYRQLVRLQRNHPHRLRVVFHVIDLRRDASYVGETALEAHRQGRFFPFLNAFFALRSAPRRNKLEPLCDRAGMDYARVQGALAAATHSKALQRNHDLLRRLGARNERTTALFNGVEFTPSITNIRGRASSLEEAYDIALARAEKLLSAGATVAEIYPLSIRAHSKKTRRPRWSSIDGVTRRPRTATFMPERPAPADAVYFGSSSGRFSAPSRRRFGRGAKHPRLVLTFYCSFQSRNCGRTWYAIEEVMRIYRGEIYMFFRPVFDDRDPSQPAARMAHEAALCAHDQGAFWEFYDHQMGILSRRQPRQLSAGDIREIARALAIDEERFATCVSSGRFATDVEALRRRAYNAGVKHTPTLVIGGRMYEGRFSTRVLRPLVAAEFEPGVLEQLVPVELVPCSRRACGLLP